MKQTIFVSNGKKSCSKCKRLLPITNFSKVKDRPCGYYSSCNKCKYITTKKWKERNPEKVRAINDRYFERNGKVVMEKNRQRLKKRRLRLRFLVFQRDNFTCCYCGRKPPEIILETDHANPKEKDEIDNYKTACRECNNGKGDMILNEFI